MLKILKTRIGQVGLLILAASATQLPQIRSQTYSPLEESTLQQVVGQIRGSCCLMGRRWGCDPHNFQQQSCVPLDVYPICKRLPPKVMACTGSRCRKTGNEDQCNLMTRIVSHNICHPEGRLTTVGCPEDEFQCKITIFPYTSATAPTSSRSVCHRTSTMCPYTYSACM